MIVFIFFSKVLGIITIILSYHPVLGPDLFKYQKIMADFLSLFKKKWPLYANFSKTMSAIIFKLFSEVLLVNIIILSYDLERGAGLFYYQEIVAVFLPLASI